MKDNPESTELFEPKRSPDDVSKMLKYIEGKSHDTKIEVRFIASHDIRLEVTYTLDRDFEESNLQKLTEIVEEQGYKQYGVSASEPNFPLTKERWRVRKNFTSVADFNESMYAKEYSLSFIVMMTETHKTRVFDAILDFNITDSEFRKNVTVELSGVSKFILMENFTVKPYDEAKGNKNVLVHAYDHYENSAGVMFEAKQYMDDTRLPVEAISMITLTVLMGLTSVGIYFILKKHPELVKEMKKRLSEHPNSYLNFELPFYTGND